MGGTTDTGPLDKTRPETTVVVASYNIRKAIGRDARRDPARILSVIRQLSADVVVLQEADYRFNGRRAIFAPADVTRQTGMSLIDYAPASPGCGWHGNLLLLGPRVTLTTARPIHLDGLEPRGALMADLAIAGMRLRVIGAHLGLFARHRRRQAHRLYDFAAKTPAETPKRETIVMGDFNGWGRTPNSLRPLSGPMDEAPCGPSFPTRHPIATLDRIFHNGPMRLASCGTLDRPEVRLASDHLPIWARFTAKATPL